MAPPTLIIPQSYRTIERLPGFEHLEFSPPSNMYLKLPDAVRFRTGEGGALQSADEAIAVRLAVQHFDDKDRANNHQITRTATIRFVRDGNIYVAVDDSPDPEENILLAGNIEELVIRTDPQIIGAIDRATKTGRVYKAAEQNEHILSLDGSYRADAQVQALIPRTAALNEAYLREEGFSQGRVYDLTAAQARSNGVDGETVLVRRVGVGGVGIVRYDLDAGDDLGSSGRARRVREKIPQETKVPSQSLP